MNLDIQQTQLPNGLRILTSRIPQVESVSLGIWITVGGRHEPAPLSGVGHFLEHLIFKGSPRRNARRISRDIEGRGGYINAYTQEESTCFYARVAFDRAAEVFDILADMVLHAKLAPPDLENERVVILDEIRMYRDQPQQLVHELLDEMIWSRHPLGRSLAGSEKTVGGMTRHQLSAWKEARYVPVNTIIAFSGRVEHEACVEQVRAAFGALPPGRRAPVRAVTSATGQEALRVVRRETEQVQLAMAFRLFGRDDPRRFALKLLSIMLGESMSSRLFNEIREKRGLAYSIQSEVDLHRDTGVLTIAAGMDPARTAKTMRLIFEQVRDLRRKPVRRGELQLAKDYATGQLRIGLESTESRVMWLGENMAAMGRVIQPQEMVDALAAVTAEEVLSVARAVFVRPRLSLAMIVPEALKMYEAEVRRVMRSLSEREEL